MTVDEGSEPRNPEPQARGAGVSPLGGYKGGGTHGAAPMRHPCGTDAAPRRYLKKKNRENKDRVPGTGEARTRPRSEHLRLIASKKRMGRIRRAVRREFILSDGKPILARDVLERSYPRLKVFLRGHRRAVWRALCIDAECVGRMLRGRGRPSLWVKRD